MPSSPSAEKFPALGSTGLTLADEFMVVEKTLLNLAQIAEAYGHKWTGRQKATLNYCLTILAGDEAEEPGAEDASA